MRQTAVEMQDTTLRSLRTTSAGMRMRGKRRDGAWHAAPARH